MSGRVTTDGVPPLAGSALALRLAGAGALGDERDDTLLYVAAGDGTLEIDGARHALTRGSASLIAAGAHAHAEGASLDLLAVMVGTEVDLHAPTGSAVPVVEPATATSEVATGSRSAEVLLGPHVGCVRATLFLGHIPPGKAPWHYHLYDEIVWIAAGSGRLHLDAGVEDLEHGSMFRLRARELHIVENTSETDELTVVGIFTPAGSPTAAYLPG